MRRRDFVRTVSLGALGWQLPQWLAASPRPGRKPKSIIWLFLYGGPSHIDLWDMKPDAPSDYRGEFNPAATSVVGTQIVEHLPRMARMAQHYSIIRSLYHVNRNHQPAGCWMFTGVNPGSDNSAMLRPRPEDPPALGSLVLGLEPPRPSPAPPFVMLPARLQDQGSALRGQSGGWMGNTHDPMLIAQDVGAPNFRVDAFEQHTGLTVERMRQRRDLLDSLDLSPLRQEPATRAMPEFQQQAFELLQSRQGQSAFDLQRETPQTRDRYGRNAFGQGCLLARRLIEAGTRVVTVSDCLQNGQHDWDTHAGNFTKLRQTLLPRLDQAYTALIEDLIDRSLLDDTVVLLAGEFGRTPKIGQSLTGAGASRDGRDHYPHCFSAIATGGRFQRGIVHGASDAKASQPTRDPLSPEDLFATLFAALDLDPAGHVMTRDGRPVPVTQGRPMDGLLR